MPLPAKLPKIRFPFKLHRYSKQNEENSQTHPFIPSNGGEHKGRVNFKKDDSGRTPLAKMTIGSILYFTFGFVLLAASVFFIWQTVIANQKLTVLSAQDTKTKQLLAKIGKEFSDLKNQDQYKRNQELSATMSAMQDTYNKSMTAYQNLLDLKTQVKDTSNLDKLFAQILKYLADKNYASAEASLQQLASSIQDEKNKLASTVTIPASAPQNNTPPGAGFSQQQVTADTGTFLVDIVAADLSSTRVVVDTASDSDCGNNCPVLPVAEYAARSGAYAAINGTFFCPTEYPQCAGKTNSFDTLLMNKNKHYFNSDNNVYSIVPAVIFSGNSARFVGRSLEWGRDTSVDSVIAMQPLLVQNNAIVYESSSDSKFTNKGTRDFIATKGSMVYIGVIFNANMTDAAHVLKAMGMENALNLDEGGSTALWVQGSYKAGPGRNVPNAVLFVRK